MCELRPPRPDEQVFFTTKRIAKHPWGQLNFAPGTKVSYTVKISVSFPNGVSFGERDREKGSTTAMTVTLRAGRIPPPPKNAGLTPEQWEIMELVKCEYEKEGEVVKVGAKEISCMVYRYDEQLLLPDADQRFLQYETRLWLSPEILGWVVKAEGKIKVNLACTNQWNDHRLESQLTGRGVYDLIDGLVGTPAEGTEPVLVLSFQIEATGF